jgi:Ca-activated chloride channel homolog
MGKIVAILFALCVFGVTLSSAQQPQQPRTTRGGGTRPRVAPTPPNSAPPQQQPQQQTDQSESSSSRDKVKRPPVLNNRSANAEQIVAPPKKPDENSSDDDEIIRVETNLVTLPVSVLDRDGRFIPNLRQQDFQILENGVPQKIEHFQPVEQPFTVVLMLDVSPSTRYQINDIRYAAIKFVDQLRPNDKVMVVTFDEKYQVLCEPTNDRRVLHYAIMQTRFRGGTSLYEAVGQVVNREIPKIEGRKAVVLFTDGVDTTSVGADFQSTLRDAEEVDALFYPIRYDTLNDMNGSAAPSVDQSVRGLGGISGIIVNGKLVQVSGIGAGGGSGTSAAEYETGRNYLENLARSSGGRKFEAGNNLDAAFAGIAEELRRQYSIGYYPETEGQPGERRQISVRVKRPNTVVRSKTSYVFSGNR